MPDAKIITERDSNVDTTSEVIANQAYNDDPMVESKSAETPATPLGIQLTQTMTSVLNMGQELETGSCNENSLDDSLDILSGSLNNTNATENENDVSTTHSGNTSNTPVIHARNYDFFPSGTDGERGQT